MYSSRSRKPDSRNYSHTSGFDVSESYKYLSDEEEEEDFENQEHVGNVSPTAANFSNLTFIRDGAKKLDNWDKENQTSILNFNHQSEARVKETGSPISRQSKKNEKTIKSGNRGAQLIDTTAANDSEISEMIHSTPLVQSDNKSITPVVLKPRNIVQLENIAEMEPEVIKSSEYVPQINGISTRRNVSFNFKGKYNNNIHEDINGNQEDVIGVTVTETAPKSKARMQSLSLEIDLLKKKLHEKEAVLAKEQQFQDHISKTERFASNESIVDKNNTKTAGNTSDPKAISPETVPKLGLINPSTNKSVYESYELHIIDELSEVELANTLKNICLKLQTPYTKLPSTIVNLPNLVKSESHLLKFANQVHRKLFSTDMEIPILGISSILLLGIRMGHKGVTENDIRRSRTKFLQSLNDMEKKVDLLKAYINEIE